MHPVQAAPRQSNPLTEQKEGEADAPRAGSAEAKTMSLLARPKRPDAPRAGSAEAKSLVVAPEKHDCDAPRAGSAEAKIL